MKSMRHRADQVGQIEKDLQRGRLLHAQGRPLEAALFFQRAIEHGANDSALPYLLSRTVRSLDATRLILPEQAARVAMVRFSPDGARILTSADDGAVTLWNAQTGERLLAYPTGGKTPYSITMNDAGTKVLVASGKDEVFLFEDAVSARLARLPGSQDPAFWIQLAGFSYHWLDRPLWAQWAVRQAQSHAHDGKPFTESAWPLLALFEAGDVSRLRSEGPTLLATLKNPTSIIGGLIMWITEAQAHPDRARRWGTLIVSEYAKFMALRWHPEIAGLTLLRRKAHSLAEPTLRSHSLAVLSLLEQRVSASALNALAAQLQVPAPSISSMPQHDRF
jgi:hypothetical protein